MTTAAQARLRGAFVEAGYTQRSLAAALQSPEPVERAAARANAGRLGASPLGTLARLFLGGEAVPRADAAAALDVEHAVAAGLLEAEGDVVAAAFAVDEWHGFHVAHDHEGDAAFDHVAGISNATRTLAALTMRHPARRALDLGTGCGSQALLMSRHAAHVVATDVTERALRVARLNLELNDVTNVELRAGSLFDPVAGERFDLIVSNPPFVVSPDSDLVFRDGGLEGDEISRLVVQGAVEHLEPAGFASMLICWGHDAGADWRERVRGWLGGAACDAWLVRYLTEDPLEYALKWAGADAAGRWVEYYDRSSIGALTTAGLVLRRRPGGEAGWFASADAESGPSGRASDQLERVFAARDFLGDLRGERLRLVPHVLDEQLQWSDGAYCHAHLVARLDDGAGVAVPLDPAALRALFALDGSLPVGDLPDADAALPTIRRLFDAGFLERSNSG